MFVELAVAYDALGGQCYHVLTQLSDYMHSAVFADKQALVDDTVKQMRAVQRHSARRLQMLNQASRADKLHVEKIQLKYTSLCVEAMRAYIK